MNYILPILITICLLIALGILIKPVFGVFLIIISVILEAFYIIIFNANLKISYIIVILVLIGLVLQVLIKGKVRIGYNPFLRIILVFLLLNFVSILYAPTILDSFKNCILYVFFVSIFFTISIYINSTDRLKTSMNLLMIATIIASLFGLIQFLVEVIFKTQMLYPNNAGYMSLSEIPQAFRSTAFFVEADQFWKFAMVALLFFLPFLNKNKLFTQISFKMVKATVFLALVSLIIAQTRSAWLGVFAGLLHYFLFDIKKGKINIKPILKMGLMASIILMGVFLMSPIVFQQLLERVIGIVNIEVGGGYGITRIAAIRSMLDLVVSSPKNILLGLGSGSLNYYGPKYAQIGVWPRFMAELGGGAFSLFLNILFNIGLLGLFVFLFFMFKFYQTNIRIKKRFETDNANPFFNCIISGSIIAFTGVMVASLVADSVHVTYFWVLLGLNAAAINLGFKEKKQI